MRKFLVALAVLLIVYVAADIGARFWAQAWVGGQFQRSLHLSKSASVSFGGILFIPEVASGHIPSATVHAASFSSEGVRFQSATLDLRDIRFSPSQLFLSKHTGSIRARSGDGSVAMTGADITTALQRQGVNVTVQVADGRVNVSGGGIPGTLTVKPSIEGHALVLAAGGVSLSLNLPEVVPGVAYRDVRIDGDVGELLFTVSHVVFVVPGRPDGPFGSGRIRVETRSKLREQKRGRPRRWGMKVERKISVARPPAEVFAHIADVRNDPSWHTDVLEVHSSTDVVEMGTVFDVRVKPSMGVSEGTMTVSRFEPGRLIEFQGRMGRMAPTVTNMCEPDAQGTLVTRRVEINPPGIMRVMSPLIASKIGKSNDGFLANLKRLLEGSGS